ncbi:hypothetical protein [Flavobacterium crassostreae]|nr:hypothetical protein [Flavobacterium crassostreae]
MLFTLWFWAVLSQNTEAIALKTDAIAFAGDAFLGSDSFGYYYTLENNVFYKKNNQTTLEYKNIYLGKITQVALQNPLKIALFYESFATIILLDNQLNEIQKINLNQNSTPIAATHIGMAAQNQLWIYDSLSQQIVLYNYLKNSCRFIATPFVDPLQHAQSDFNYFYWIDPNQIAYSCDLFGNIRLLAKIPDYEKIQILSKQQYIYYQKGRFFYVDTDPQKSFEFEIPEKSFQNFYYKDQNLAIFTTKEISNYKIIIP